MDIIPLLINILIGAATGLVASTYMLRHKKRPKNYILSPDVGEWISLEKQPIPMVDGISSLYFGMKILVTDGRCVEYSYAPTYNEKGELIMERYGNRNPITHWRPMPKPPKE